MKIKYSILSLIAILSTFIGPTYAQLNNPYKASIELQTTVSTNGSTPFWMRSNQFGSIPLKGLSGSAIGKFSKHYDGNVKDDSSIRSKLLDWGFGLEGRANGGKGSNALLIEAYIKGKLGIFQLKAGRSKDVMGLNGDTSLSSGNFAISGNALGIPKVEISIPEFYRVPILNGLISIKGTLSHGWLGHVAISDQLSPAVFSKNVNPYTYFHQKSFYGKLGRNDWRLELIGGFNHQAFWGSEEEVYGKDLWGLSAFKTLMYVATGSPYDGNNSRIESSKIGNQLGSIDLGVNYRFDKIKVNLYRQTFYDVGALSKLANIQDGLNGLSVENLQPTQHSKNFTWRKLLVELFYSKNQAGYPWSKNTKSGDENYYNNYLYKQGWSYKGIGLGNPLITRNVDADGNQAIREENYFFNNRVMAIHAGISGGIMYWDFSAKATYSKNYGTFGTSKYGSSIGNVRHPPIDNLFQQVNQLSLILTASKELKKGYNVGFTIAGDNGKLLKNSLAAQLSLSKHFR